MILSVDIGNTKTCLAVYADDVDAKLHSKVYLIFDTNKLISKEALQDYVRWRLSNKGVDFEDISVVCVSSVVPALSKTWAKFVEDTQAEFFLFNYELALKLINVSYPHPEEVADDFYCAAIAADRLYPGASIVVDFGTATNFSFIDSNSTFVGGIICPGIDLGMKALVSNASLIESFHPELPKHTIGQSSDEALQSGIVLGEAKRADGLIQAAIAEWDEKDPNIIFSGGYSKYLSSYSHYDVIVDKELVLKGVYIAYKELVA